MGMRALKFHYYDMNTQETVKITDTIYERLEHVAKIWNMTIQDVVRVLIANGLKEKEQNHNVDD